MHRNRSTSLSIGDGIVVVPCQVITKIFCHGLEFMVLQLWNQLLRTKMRAIEFEIRIRNMIQLMQGLQHALVERNTMRHHRQTFHLVLHVVPYLGKQRRMIRVLIGNTVHLGCPKVVSVRHRLDEAIETVDNLIIPYDDQTHTARTRHLTIGTFKVNGGKVAQMVFRYI